MPRTSIDRSALDWSLQHHLAQGDNDLFPRLFEIGIIEDHWPAIARALMKKSVDRYDWHVPRRLLVPKDDISFRAASQLEPLDSILFSAIIRVIGPQIEATRISTANDAIFSARFAPTTSGQLYIPDTWSHFWRRSKSLAATYPIALVTDLSDFYNQISHQSVLRQLEQCAVPSAYISAVSNFLERSSGASSRGIPIGPRSTHLLAEAAFIPIDHLLRTHGYVFTRYVDDIHIFCANETDARCALFELADYLDGERLSINRQKTRILPADDLVRLANRSLDITSTSDAETKILNAINAATTGPYDFEDFHTLTPDQQEAISSQSLEEVFESILSAKEVSYVRLRWFLRRLAQVGTPNGIEYVTENLARMAPALSDATKYLLSAAANYEGGFGPIGQQLLEALELPVVQKSAYLQFAILSMFGHIRDLNHIDRLAQRFLTYGPLAQREIVLAAGVAHDAALIRRFHDLVPQSDSWLHRALIFAARGLLPKSEVAKWSVGHRGPAQILEQLMLLNVPRVRPSVSLHVGAIDNITLELECIPSTSLDHRTLANLLNCTDDRLIAREALTLGRGTLDVATIVMSGDLPSLLLMAEGGALDELVRRGGAVRVLTVKSGRQLLYEAVPECTSRKCEITDVSPAEAVRTADETDVVILTTTPAERRALLSVLRPRAGHPSVQAGAIGHSTYRFGQIGRYFVAHVESTMGSVAREAAQLTVADAIHEVRPKAIVVVGISFGVDRLKQHLGDVLGAESVWPYELMKVGEEIRTPRGMPVPSGSVLAERFRSGALDWQLSRVLGLVEYCGGAVLSGEKLVNNPVFRDSLLATCPTAIGGDMEGAGAYSAAARYKIEIMLVKSICDWADGHKNDRAQPFAAFAAADLVRHVLSKPGVLEQLGAVDHGIGADDTTSGGSAASDL